MRDKLIALLLLALLSISACNEPSLYNKHAREFLVAQGEPAALIELLTKQQTIDAAEANRLAAYDNRAVLHLVAANPGSPLALLERLAQHEDMEIRTGVASNASAPLELLLTLRTPGKYTTVNSVLARNPNIPQTLLWEMHNNKEAGYISFAMNPNCPLELMYTIAHKGEELDRTWLAYNPNLPTDLMALFENDPSELVRKYLGWNPAYQQWKAASGS